MDFLERDGHTMPFMRYGVKDSLGDDNYQWALGGRRGRDEVQ